MGCSTGDETALEDVGTIYLSFGRKERVKDMHTEKAISFKLAEDGNISEYLSAGQGCKDIE